MAELTDPDVLVQRERLLALADEADRVAQELYDLTAQDDQVEAEYTRGMLQLNAAGMRRNARRFDDGDDPEMLAETIDRSMLELQRSAAHAREAKAKLATAKRSARIARIWRWVFIAGILIVLVNLGFQLGRFVTVAGL